MYSNKEVGELLGSVFVGACKVVYEGAKFFIVAHFVMKYW